MNDALSPSSQSVSLPAAATAGDVLTVHLTAQAGAFLRALPLVHALPRTDGPPRADGGPDDRGPGGPADRVGELLRAVRRVGGALHTFAAVVQPGWAQELRDELRWLLGTLSREPSCDRRLARLLGSLDSLTGTAAPDRLPPQRGAEPPGADRSGGTGILAGHAGAAKARALLERQLTAARSRVHSENLQQLRSARLHALADRMTLMSGEVPLAAPAAGPAAEVLLPQAAAALRALERAARALPLASAGTAYNGDALHRLGREGPSEGRGPGTAAGDPGAAGAPAADDAPWLRVRILAKRARYALEVCEPLLDGQAAGTAARLGALGRVLDRHQEAADAAAAAAAVACTPRITPATAYVLGVVHADQRLEVEAARYAFGRQWPEVADPARHGWAVR
ncbi:CHAD domain-containing protein [Streptomyces sp. NPDC001380]|uniref:CHAD domain-containing protein n=1 Tax=Streptomyces sp. NPDC001380 TaxID=3364566 RepID=UPI0036AE92F3